MTAEDRSSVLTVEAPTDGTVVALPVRPGDTVAVGATLVVLEVMKMEHPVRSTTTMRVTEVLVADGDTVERGRTIIRGHAARDEDGSDDEIVNADAGRADVGADRDDVAELRRARERIADSARPEAVERRRALGMRTARENVADLTDAGSFREYGGFAFAAQERRRTRDDLETNTPADGLITGIGRVNGELVGEERAACAVLAYDYTVLAGTQGWRNHHKKDRILEIAARLDLPVVLFAEGGGGRPGDTDAPTIAGLDTRAFELFADLVGRVPTIGIAAGRCFAGNAALLGCCDVIIATEGSNIGMGGPAMIEGGGLGVFSPEEIGPIDVQTANGVVDLRARDEAHAVELARRCLAFFQGDVDPVDPPPDIDLAAVVPEHRKTVYDSRRALAGIADEGSVLELGSGHGGAVITAFARIRGRAIGVLANDPMVLGGAIDASAADKAARFIRLCDSHGLPVLSLCDTPGFLVGPDAERSGQVRRFADLFVSARHLSVPLVMVVLRKAYGLGAMAMAGGSFRAPDATLSWPSGEFGGMGLEGAVRLGYRAELEAIEDPQEREATFDAMVDAAYRHGRALNTAAHLEIDDVIEPEETRDRVADLLLAHRPTSASEHHGTEA